jgi:SAM-dependent methyltransferase
MGPRCLLARRLLRIPVVDMVADGMTADEVLAGLLTPSLRTWSPLRGGRAPSVLPAGWLMPRGPQNFFAYRHGTTDHGSMPDRDTTPELYLHGHHDSVLRSHRRRTVESSAAYLLPRLTRDARVLDVGCGPGTITVGLAARVPDGFVVGLDAAPGVLEEARSLPEAAHLPNLRFEVGDVYQLGFDDSSFDVVHAHQVLQHLADPVRALAEMRRVCRAGGVVAGRDGDYGAMCWHPATEGLAEWQALYRAVARSAGGEPDAGRRLRAWAVEAGFSSVEASASAWCFSTPDERAWWGGLWAERLTKSRFADQATAAGLATPADLERLAAAWQRWAATDNACFFVLHGEVLATP